MLLGRVFNFHQIFSFLKFDSWSDFSALSKNYISFNTWLRECLKKLVSNLSRR